MSSNLFSIPIIDEYRRNPEIIRALRGVQLLTFHEYQTWLNGGLPRSRLNTNPRLAAKEFSSTPAKLELRNAEDEEKELKSAVRVLASNVCHNEISSHYLRHTIQRTLDTPGEYDLLVAVAPGYSSVETIGRDGVKLRSQTIIGRRMQYVLGFIVAQLGECALEPNVWVVNLICARSSMDYSIKGTILMGAYLYCIKNGQIDKMGKLELAAGFGNPNGYFSYCKSGFNPDLRLYSAIPKCFVDANNLPMEVDLEPLENEQIIGMAVGIIPRQYRVTVTWPWGEISSDDEFFELGYTERAERGNEQQERMQIIQEDIQLELGENIMTLYQLRIMKYLYEELGKPELFELDGDPDKTIANDSDPADNPTVALFKKFSQRVRVEYRDIEKKISNTEKKIRELKLGFIHERERLIRVKFEEKKFKEKIQQIEQRRSEGKKSRLQEKPQKYRLRSFKNPRILDPLRGSPSTFRMKTSNGGFKERKSNRTIKRKRRIHKTQKNICLKKGT